MAILVTGGAGFIGSHVCEWLLDRKDSVICIDNFNDYYNPKIKEKNIKGCLSNTNFKVYRTDIRDFEKLENVFLENNIKKIVHMAARAGVRASLMNPKLYFDVNVNGTKNLLDLAVKYNIKNFVFGSSSSVYGTNKKIPFSESDETNNQISPYGKSKKEAEILCKKYHEKSKLNITCLRLFTVYGPRTRPDMALYKFVDKISKDEPISIYTDKEDFEKGEMARDFTFIKDIVDGIVLALDKVRGFEIFNLGKGQPIKLNEFISIIESCLGKKAIKKFVGRQEGDVPITYADISKAKKMLRYNPTSNIKEGIKEFVDWFRRMENEDSFC